MTVREKTDVAIIGAGTAGTYALREVKRAKRDFRLIDHGPLGSTCARVGCMPSKAALHAGALWQGRQAMRELGVDASGLALDRATAWARVRKQRDRFASGTADQVRKAAGERLIMGRARFLEPTLLEIQTDTGRQQLQARSIIIATGSRPVVPDFLREVRDRTITTDDIFDLQDLPATIAILGLGAIGLEMGLALARLGVQVTGADLAPQIAGVSDPELAQRATQHFSREMALWLGVHARVERSGAGILLRAGERQVEAPLLLAALGRRPNVDELGLAEAGFELDDRGLPAFDRHTLQVGKLPVFMAGDANADRPLMHEAADQGAIAGYNAVHMTPLHFARKTRIRIAFSNPDVIGVGQPLDTLDPDRIVTGTARGNANGRALILDAEDSLLRIYADRASGQLLGAAALSVGGEHLAHLLAWAIQRGETAKSLLTLPFYHPTVEEMLQAALQDIMRQTASDTVDALPFGLEFMD